MTDLAVGASADNTGGTDRGAVHVLFLKTLNTNPVYHVAQHGQRGREHDSRDDGDGNGSRSAAAAADILDRGRGGSGQILDHRRRAFRSARLPISRHRRTPMATTYT